MQNYSPILIGLQIFGTLFFILLSFLGMTAWIVRRIDKVSDKVGDVETRLARVEGKIDTNGKVH